MSPFIVLAASHSVATSTWDTLASFGVAAAKLSRREQMSPQDIQGLMLKALQHTPNARSHGAQPSGMARSLDKLWTELAVDLTLANFEQTHWGWAQTLDPHTPAFWQAFDADARFILAYTHPTEGLADALAQCPPDADQLTQAIEQHLANWCSSQTALLAVHYQLGESSQLVHISGTATTCQRFGLSIIEQVATPNPLQAPETTYSSLLLQIVQQHTQTQAVWSELQAASAYPAQAPVAQQPSALDCLRALHERFHATGELQQAHASAQRALQDAQTQCSTLSEALSLATAQRTDALETSQALQQRNQTLTAQLAELTEQHQVLQNKLTASAQECEIVLEQLHHAQEALEETCLQDQAARKQLDQSNALTQQLTADIAALGEARKATEAQFTLATAETAELKAELGAMAEENNLLLAHMHQAQEELEQYYLKYQDAVNGSRPPLQANGFWRTHPPAGLRMDLRHPLDGNNWYEAEADGRWTGPGLTSTLQLPPLAGGTYKLALTTVDVMQPSILLGLTIQAVLAGTPQPPVPLIHGLQADNPTYPSISTCEMTLPHNADTWQLRLTLPHNICPADIGRDDRRRLGLRLQSLRIIAVD